MGMPEEEKREVPAYMVSFGDMITLLLTFFILLVALADTQQAGLVGAGQGPIIPHLLAEGKPGILKGRLIEERQKHKRDMWWVPSEEGDPDQLEQVREKLDEEIPTTFKPSEASIHYEQEQLVLRLPARIEYNQEDGRPQLTDAVLRTLDTVAEEVGRSGNYMVRINGDVPDMGNLELELRESAMQARMIYDNLIARGVPKHSLSIWGWGDTRPVAGEARSDTVNRGIAIDIFRVEEE